jgi:hypothetical protein
MQGAPISVNAMPKALAKALIGSQRGDYRLYASDDGKQHYVIRVIEQIAPNVKPYADVRTDLAREVEGEKVAAALREYAVKLRQIQKVDVVITRISG